MERPRTAVKGEEWNPLLSERLRSLAQVFYLRLLLKQLFPRVQNPYSSPSSQVFSLTDKCTLLRIIEGSRAISFFWVRRKVRKMAENLPVPP